MQNKQYVIQHVSIYYGEHSWRAIRRHFNILPKHIPFIANTCSVYVRVNVGHCTTGCTPQVAVILPWSTAATSHNCWCTYHSAALLQFRHSSLNYCSPVVTHSLMDCFTSYFPHSPLGWLLPWSPTHHWVDFSHGRLTTGLTSPMVLDSPLG